MPWTSAMRMPGGGLLDETCGADRELREQVEHLLAASENARSFLESPAVPFLVANTLANTPTTAGSDLAAGTIIAERYKLIEEIGHGGMGSVWVAQQTEPVRRAVAVKLIKRGMDSKALIARFDAERQALAMMDHPNIAKVFDGGVTADGRPFFVMELVKGMPITAFCDANRYTPRQRLELFATVCQAIQHAHQKGVIHRDIKPGNVLIAMYDDRPVPKVIDFGVAKAADQSLTEQTLLTGFGTLVGTPQYMSPEQATLNNLDVDTRSDVYSLGVLLYELLAGSPPFAQKEQERAGVLEMLRVVREVEPPRPSSKLSTADALPSLAANRGMEPKKLTGLLRNELDWVVMKALEKDRSRRYETANGFAADVQRYLAGETVLAVPPSRAYRLRKFVRKNRGPVLAAATIAAMLIAGVAVSSWLAVRAMHAEDIALRAVEDERTATKHAEDAIEAEKQALAKAQKRLKQVEKGNEIITSIFTDLEFREIRDGRNPLEAMLAKRLVKLANEIDGETLGDQLAVADLQDKLAGLLLNLGFPIEAIPLYQKAIDTRNAQLGEDHRLTFHSELCLANCYHETWKFDLERPLLERCMKIRIEKYGAEDSRAYALKSLG